MDTTLPDVSHLVGRLVTLPHADRALRGPRLDGSTASGFVDSAVARHESGRVVLRLASGITVLASDSFIEMTR